ncbi:hypothetical protein HGRIS_007045 [Hohenbuehelia grisea]|uniref:C2 domain-containing protein n=1 Tax=Hohenbuehelia grisea TaxID=104357 RepID=A0ABR3JAW0_9AGAR
MAEEFNLIITVLRATGLRVKSLVKRPPNSFVKVHWGKFVRQTSVVKASIKPAWEEGLMVHAVELGTTLTIELFDKGLGPQRSLGCHKAVLRDLFEKQGDNSEMELTIDDISIFVHLRKEELGALAAESLADSANLARGPGFNFGLDPPVSESFAGVVASVAKLMETLDSFAKVHPYANAAWKTLTLVYRVIETQLDRDAKVRSLLATMDNLYSFVNPLENLVKDHEELHPSLENIVTSILKQTIECVLFIQEYSGLGFAGKAIKHTLSTADARIEAFKESFLNLGSSLDTGLGLQNALISLRTSHGVQELVIHNTLNPVRVDWSSRPICHPRTCLDMLQLVTAWINNASSPTKILWLSGLAGAGKSTLSTTIASFYTDLRRLGAFIFFDRDVKEQSDPMKVIRTLAFQLSRFDARIARGVQRAIESNAHVAGMQLDAQFRELIRQPLADASTLAEEGPIVIVLDALDECGSPSERARLLSLLAKETAELPLAFRIIITSRDEPDISAAFSTQAHVRHETLEVYPDNGDIEIYMRPQLVDIAERSYLEESWPGHEQIAALVKRAAGLFIWASTACKYIDAYNPEERLEELLQAENRNDALNNLYVKALTASGDWKNPRFKKDCVAILGCILVARNPVSPEAIDKLLRVKSLRAVSRLASVLRFQSASDPVRILHASFRDYISDPHACNGSPWLIELDKHEAHLTECCLRFLQETLVKPTKKLNINEKPDRQVDETVEYACSYWIPHVCEVKGAAAAALVPAVRDFMKAYLIRWLELMSIMGKSRTTPSLLEHLHAWVKVSAPADKELSQLTNDAYRFAGFFADSIAEHPALISLAALPFAPLESKLYELYHDEETLPTVLGGYQKQWSPSLRVLQRLDTSVISVAFSPDESKIVSCGAEPDDTTPFWNENESVTVRSWDATTGLEAIPSISVDAYAVVRFSPDGSEIWAADARGSYTVFDAGTGDLRRRVELAEWLTQEFTMYTVAPQTASPPSELVHAKSTNDIPSLDTDMSLSAALNEAWKPPVTHSSPVTHSPVTHSPVTHSPVTDTATNSEAFFDAVDASDSSDTDEDANRPEPPTRKSTMAPNADSEGAPLGGSVPTFTFSRAAFSPDGRYVAYGAEEGVMLVLDTESGEQAFEAITFEPLEDRDVVRLFPSIAISKDNVVAVAVKQGPVLLIDAADGEELQKLTGHAAEVIIVAFSQDGRRLYSGSEDGVICTFDVGSGKQIHSVTIDGVRGFQPLAFSQDSRVASTSTDGTIQIWDTKTGREVGPLLQGHFNAVSAMTFADDSKKLVSGAFLNNIQIWDTTIPSGKLNTRMQRHDRPPHVVAFSPDCLRVRSSRPDETKFWNSITGRELQMKPYKKDAVFHQDEENGEIIVKDQGSGAIIELIDEGAHTVLPDDFARWAGRLREAAGVHIGIDCDRGGNVNIEERTVWRLPMEFKHRSSDWEKNFIVFGIWSGRVFVVHLPEKIL